MKGRVLAPQAPVQPWLTSAVGKAVAGACILVPLGGLMLAIVASNVVPSTVAIQVGLAGGFACGLGWLALTQVGYKAGLYSGVPRFRLIHLICTGMGLFAGYGTYAWRSEEHTSDLQSLMRISYAVFCLNKKIKN